MMEIIKAENLNKTFIQGGNELKVLREINLTVLKEEILAIVGPSGAGKSTLLYILGLLSVPTDGRLVFKGKEIDWSDEKGLATFRNRAIGFIFQFHYLLPDFTALENVMLPAMIKGEKSSNLKNNSSNLLSAVGLSARVNHRPGELSGGEQQRVAIARALINNPELILADEPTGDLDTVQAKVVWDLLYGLSRDKNLTMVVVTHNEEFARASSSVVHIHDGKII